MLEQETQPEGRQERENVVPLEQWLRFPPGHYHSPVPSPEEVREYFQKREDLIWFKQFEQGGFLPPLRPLPEIALDDEAHWAFLQDLARYYRDLPFPEHAEEGATRYFYQNGWFPATDAIVLYGFLRKYQPRRIIEVGSGYSSAVILDTVERFFTQRPEITFIEPYPDRLLRLLRPEDRWVRLVRNKVQDISPDVFRVLAAGDLLFIDSSHVVKCGSDVQFLLFEVLPLLNPGVFVHFHDIFYPFEYPAEWILNGRHWNEAYFLRAFLAYNSAWKVHFFVSYASIRFQAFIRERMPRSSANPGGSLYLSRVG